MVGGVVAVVGAVAADVRGEEGVVVSTEQTRGLQSTLHGIVLLFNLSYTFFTLALQDYSYIVVSSYSITRG